MPKDDGIEASIFADAEMNGNAAEPLSRGKRSAARLAAVQALYQIDVADASPEEVLRAFKDEALVESRSPDFRASRSRQPDCLKTWCWAFSVSSLQSVAALEAALSDVGHSVDRLEVLLRALLRAGAYELNPMSAVPSKVVINEYVDLAHAFFAGKEPALVNAVLDRLGLQLPTRGRRHKIQMEPMGSLIGSTSSNSSPAFSLH